MTTGAFFIFKKYPEFCLICLGVQTKILNNSIMKGKTMKLTEEQKRQQSEQATAAMCAGAKFLATIWKKQEGGKDEN